ncbi:MAG: class I SAM-dependent RNA methyltransferase, partial [Nitrospirales bacterium]
LTEFFRLFGSVLKQRFAGWRVYVLTADLKLPSLLRLAESRRVPLFNGPLECRLFEFQMVEGSMRQRTPAN